MVECGRPSVCGGGEKVVRDRSGCVEKVHLGLDNVLLVNRHVVAILFITHRRYRSSLVLVSTSAVALHSTTARDRRPCDQ